MENVSTNSTEIEQKSPAYRLENLQACLEQIKIALNHQIHAVETGDFTVDGMRLGLCEMETTIGEIVTFVAGIRASLSDVG
jgi:hypothetical protein